MQHVSHYSKTILLENKRFSFIFLFSVSLTHCFLTQVIRIQSSTKKNEMVHRVISIDRTRTYSMNTVNKLIDRFYTELNVFFCCCCCCKSMFYCNRLFSTDLKFILKKLTFSMNYSTLLCSMKFIVFI